jgi:hypothetical protein
VIIDNQLYGGPLDGALFPTNMATEVHQRFRASIKGYMWGGERVPLFVLDQSGPHVFVYRLVGERYEYEGRG